MLFSIVLIAVVHSALASSDQVVVQKPRYSPAEAVSSQSYVRQHHKTQIKYEIPNLRHVIPIQQKEVPSRVQYNTPAPEKYFIPAQQSYPSSTPTPHVNNFLPAANHQQYSSSPDRQQYLSASDQQQYSSSSADGHPGIQYVQQYRVPSSNENHSSASKLSPQGSQVLYNIPVYTRYTQVQSKDASNDEQGQTQAIFNKQSEEASYESQPEVPANAHYATQAAAQYAAAIAGHSATPNKGHYETATAGHYATPNKGHYETANAGHYVTANAGHYVTPNAGHYITPNAGHYAPPNGGHYATQTAGQYATRPAVNFVQPTTYVKYAPEAVVKATAQQPQEAQYPKYRLVYAPAAQQESAQQHSASPSQQQGQQQYGGADHAQEAYNVFANIKAAQYQPDDSQNYKIVLSTPATPTYQKSAYPQQQPAIQYYHQ